MTDARAISGDYADLKLVKTRSVMQVVVEIPIEEGERFVSMFGVPQPGKPIKVAVARIGNEKPDAPLKPADKSKSYAQRAGILCGQPGFWVFLRDKYMPDAGMDDGILPHAMLDADFAATALRVICDVESRRDLIPGTPAGDKFHEIELEYRIWEKDMVPA